MTDKREYIKQPDIDVSQFDDLVEEGLRAIANDAGFALEILEVAGRHDTRRKNVDLLTEYQRLTGQRRIPVGWKTKDALAIVKWAMQYNG